jgi:hypothetical protein
MLGRVVSFVAGGWLLISAFAWPQSEAACANTLVGGVLCIAYSLLAIFFAPARYLNTLHACVICAVSLSIDVSGSASSANNVIVAAVIFGASLMPVPDIRAPGGPGLLRPQSLRR